MDCFSLMTLMSFDSCYMYDKKYVFGFNVRICMDKFLLRITASYSEFWLECPKMTFDDKFNYYVTA